MTLLAPALSPAALARRAAPRPSRRRHRGRWPWETSATERRRLADCLLLAALIHLLLVLLIGNAPGGSARPGQGVGGRLNVVLRIYDRPGPDVSRPEPTASPAPAPPRAVAGDGTRSPGTAPARPPEAHPPPRKALTEPESLPSPVPRITLPAPQPTEAAEPPPAPPLAAPPQPAPPSPQAVEPVEIAPAMDTAPVSPPPVEAPPTEPSMLTTPPAVPVRQAPIESAIPVPSTLPTPALVQPPELKAADVPVPAPPVVPGIAPPQVVAPAPATPAAPGMPAAATTESRPPSQTTGAPSGDREAVPTRGPDVAQSALPAASAPAPLNLQLPRARGGELSGRAAPGLLPLLPRPAERPSKLGTDIENAAKPDCRSAYSAMGLLAAAPLAANAATGSGCRW